MASKRVERWSAADQEWVAQLPEPERELVLLLAAYLGARPSDKEPADDK